MAGTYFLMIATGKICIMEQFSPLIHEGHTGCSKYMDCRLLEPNTGASLYVNEIL
jgi:hypothetical protein